MFKPTPVFKVLFASFFALALVGCQYQARDPGGSNAKPDPRMAKNFAESESQFCSFQFPYSETTGKGASATEQDVVQRVVITGENKTAMMANFAATCAASAPAPKLICKKILSDPKSYPCVAPSIFSGAPDTAGLWSCKLPFEANDKSETLTIDQQTTASAAISAAFTACAALTDDGTETPENVVTKPTVVAEKTATPAPSGTPTPVPTTTVYLTPSKRRDACAAAMIAQKLVCQNANAIPDAPPIPPKRRRLFRAPRNR